MQNQQVVGEPDLDSKDHYLKKQEGLRISLEKIGVVYVIGESRKVKTDRSVVKKSATGEED